MQFSNRARLLISKKIGFYKWCFIDLRLYALTFAEPGKIHVYYLHQGGYRTAGVYLSVCLL